MCYRYTKPRWGQGERRQELSQTRQSQDKMQAKGQLRASYECVTTHQDLEASSCQEGSKLERQMVSELDKCRKGEAQDRQTMCQHLGQNIHIYQWQGVSDSTLDSSLGKRCSDKEAKTLRNKGSQPLCPRIPKLVLSLMEWYNSWSLGEPTAIFHWKVWLKALGRMPKPLS